MEILRNASVIGILFLFLTAGSQTQAAECRQTTTVVNSAKSMQINTAVGGHVSIHVVGFPTEAGKSRFNSEQDFLSTFTKWRAGNGIPSPTPKTCGGGSGGQMDCVRADKLGITSASVCDQVDNQGNCTAQHEIEPVKIAFRYAKSQGLWILNTSYPSMNDNCQ